MSLINLRMACATFWARIMACMAGVVVTPRQLLILPCLLGLLSLLLSANAQGQTSAENATGNEAPQTNTSEDRLFVEVKQAAIRAEPKVWSRALRTLQFGDELRAIDSAALNAGATISDWIRVQASSQGANQGLVEGFIHRTAVTRRVVVLKGSTTLQQVSATEQEVVLAGKGFSADVEDRYRQRGDSADRAIQLGNAYIQLDTIERDSADSPDELERFMREGGFRL